MAIRPQKFDFGHIFVDLSYLCYSLDFPKLSELEGYRKPRRKMGWDPAYGNRSGTPWTTLLTLEIEVLTERAACLLKMESLSLRQYPPCCVSTQTATATLLQPVPGCQGTILSSFYARCPFIMELFSYIYQSINVCSICLWASDKKVCY